MTAAPALSIVMPIHDKAECLARVMDALDGQQVPAGAVECIAVFDKCGDDSHAVFLRSRIGKDASTQVLHTDFGSPSRARNAGLELAQGAQILFLDADVIVPAGLLARLLQLHAQDAATVAMVPVYCNAQSDSIMPYLAETLPDFGAMRPGDEFRWAAREPLLHDLRETVFGSDGLDHLPFPWVVGWSTALAVPAAIARAAGGFDTALVGRGSEDLEFCRRLWRRGAHFRLVSSHPAFHWPHARDRGKEEQRDIEHEQQMLMRYPAHDVELLKSFGGDRANAMEIILRAALTGGVLSEIAASYRDHILPGGLPDEIGLVCGLPPGSLLPPRDGMRHVWPPQDSTPEEGAGALRLYGFALPFTDGAVDSAVVAGWWEVLPEELAARSLAEVKRVARQVFLVRRRNSSLLGKRLFDSTAVALANRPYWERNRPLSRSMWDHPLTQIGGDARYAVFQVN